MKITIVLAILTIVTIIISCEDPIVNDEVMIEDVNVTILEFCQYVPIQNFDGLETKIEHFLDSIVVNHTDSDIYFEIEISSLKLWLEEKVCVTEVIVWPWIIETNPEIKELSITFTVNNLTLLKVLDVRLDMELDVRFHGNGNVNRFDPIVVRGFIARES